MTTKMTVLYLLEIPQLEERELPQEYCPYCEQRHFLNEQASLWYGQERKKKKQRHEVRRKKDREMSLGFSFADPEMRK